MGEYHTIRRSNGSIDTLCKVGTCDDWRYVRHAEAVRLGATDAGVRADFRHMLADPQTLYRFPWPEEDAHEHSLDHINRRDMFHTVTLPIPQALLQRFDHRERCVSVSPHDLGAWNVNVFLPCPLSAGFALRNSGASSVVSIYGERYDAHGHARTIFQCGYCEAPFSLHEEDVQQVRYVWARWGTHQQAYYQALAARLKAKQEA